MYYLHIKINNTLTDSGETLDVIMPMYNFIKYNKNYSKTSGSLWNYYRDKPISSMVDYMNYSIKDSKSFGYMMGITGNLEGIYIFILCTIKISM